MAVCVCMLVVGGCCRPAAVRRSETQDSQWRQAGISFAQFSNTDTKMVDALCKLVVELAFDLFVLRDL